MEVLDGKERENCGWGWGDKVARHTSAASSNLPAHACARDTWPGAMEPNRNAINASAAAPPRTCGIPGDPRARRIPFILTWQVQAGSPRQARAHWSNSGSPHPPPPLWRQGRRLPKPHHTCGTVFVRTTKP